MAIPSSERKIDLSNDKLPEAQKEAIIKRFNDEIDSIPKINIEVEVIID